MIEVSYDPDSRELPPDNIIEKMYGAAQTVCAKHNIEEAEVSLSFVSPKEIRNLNSKHRGIDKTTDVLSFPQYDESNEPELSRIGAVVEITDVPSFPKHDESKKQDEEGAPPEILGDIVICTKQAQEQSEEYGHSQTREFVYLFVHGLLHLLGYDHENDDERKEMREQEEITMGEINL
ncbi:MAG: rRNA maturation RNase YbeY [Clostridiales Family XIII bacterium]|jgi:probable rRNA maturation factor|nr:rRNA maturation RNase YbeY [Clostridiales Family XIII bacterium]